jgi:hypothetical protein
VERNAKFAKEMASLKEQLKKKSNWNRVDLVMVGYFFFVITIQQKMTI